MKSLDLKKTLEQMKNLYQLIGDFKILDSIGNYGYIIEKIITEKTIDKNGNVSKKTKKVFNILRYNNEIVCDRWFDVYTVDQEGNCIIGYTRSYRDYEKLRNMSGYTYASGLLYQKYIYIYGAINRVGNLSVEPIYDSLSFNNEDTFIAESNKKFGYLSIANGEHITPIIFDEARCFSEGLACICYHHQYGYINRNNIITNPDNNHQYAISPQYEWAQDFKKGYAQVCRNYQVFKINRHNIEQIKEDPYPPHKQKGYYTQRGRKIPY